MTRKFTITTIIILLIINFLSAKTYTITSGKWTDANTWGDNYPGAVIKATDVVIVTGTLVINTSVTIEGTLQVEKGGSLVGLKDLMIAKSGTFINNGNTAMNHIINEGTVMNNQSMEAINNIDNSGRITNTSNMVAGNDFNNSGVVEGKKSTYFVQNSLVNSATSQFGKDIKFFCGNTVDAAQTTANNAPGTSVQANTPH